MQINFDTTNRTNTYNQHFGNIVDKTGNVLFLRTKKPRRYQIIDSIIRSMEDSSLNAEITKYNQYSNRLIAKISDKFGNKYTYSEPLLDSWFRDPVKFVKNLRNVMLQIEKE